MLPIRNQMLIFHIHTYTHTHFFLVISFLATLTWYPFSMVSYFSQEIRSYLLLDQKLFFYCFLHFFYCSSTDISVFSLPLPLSHPSSPPTFDATPPWLCPCVFYTCSLMTLSLFPTLSVPSGYCQFVLYFHVSGCVLLAGSFC